MSATSWIEIDGPDRFGLITFRCRYCRRLAVAAYRYMIKREPCCCGVAPKEHRP